MTNTADSIRNVGDVVATIGTAGVVVSWITAASIIITLVVGILATGWWIMRYYEKFTGKQFEDLRWVRWIFRRT